MGDAAEGPRQPERRSSSSSASGRSASGTPTSAELKGKNMDQYMDLVNKALRAVPEGPRLTGDRSGRGARHDRTGRPPQPAHPHRRGRDDRRRCRPSREYGRRLAAVRRRTAVPGRARVYTLLVVELLLLLTTLPGLVPLLLLDRDASNLPLVALPARAGRPGGLRRAVRPAPPAPRPDRPAARRPVLARLPGQRAGALRIWVPTLVWLTVHRGEPRPPGRARPSRAGGRCRWCLIAVGVTLLGGERAGDHLAVRRSAPATSLRLAVYFLLRTPGVTLGNAAAARRGGRDRRGLLRGGPGAVRLGRVLAVLRIGDPMVDLIEKEFVA